MDDFVCAPDKDSAFGENIFFFDTVQDIDPEGVEGPENWYS